MEKEIGTRSEKRMWEGREGWEKVRQDRKGTVNKEKEEKVKEKRRRICTLRTRKEFIYMKVEK
jgi:hypothetical protein